jgi:hypothetical protein
MDVEGISSLPLQALTSSKEEREGKEGRQVSAWRTRRDDERQLLQRFNRADEEKESCRTISWNHCYNSSVTR